MFLVSPFDLIRSRRASRLENIGDASDHSSVAGAHTMEQHTADARSRCAHARTRVIVGDFDTAIAVLVVTTQEYVHVGAVVVELNLRVC